jgi:hypothetical protein
VRIAVVSTAVQRVRELLVTLQVFLSALALPLRATFSEPEKSTELTVKCVLSGKVRGLACMVLLPHSCCVVGCVGVVLLTGCVPVEALDFGLLLRRLRGGGKQRPAAGWHLHFKVDMVLRITGETRLIKPRNPVVFGLFGRGDSLLVA